MSWFRGGRAEAVTPSGSGQPRDVEAIEDVLSALDGGVTDDVDAHRKVTDGFVQALGFEYGAVWLPGDGDTFWLAGESGPLVAEIAAAGAGTRMSPSAMGLAPEALRTRRPVLVHGDEPAPTCARWTAARGAGMVTGCAMPVLEGGKVVSVKEFYTRGELPFFGPRAEKWEALERLVSRARHGAVATAQLQETLNDRAAVTEVVSKVSLAKDEQAALRIALDTVRSAFGWQYGSFWALDEEANVLRFAVESGSAGDEFRKVTLAASFAEGVGLSGRAWRARDLVFVRDLAEVSDCVRAPSAQRAGVKSGVCFPILSNGRVIGTMDFFVTRAIELSETRASALRNVQQLVSQRLDILRRAEDDQRNAASLLETVSQLREAGEDAGRVAAEAVGRASVMTAEVDALGQASAAIGDVIKIISNIADQTNLLALNATIEAARAGEVGRGFAVVAGEVKDLARETAAATQRVTEQIAGIQASSQSVSSGIHATSEIIGQLDAVQARIVEALEAQARMAQAFDTH
ncbi:methyl-accepting chemotaxis protein [Motilibacter aurantiacus]|uniref:methyl-accepting chemotaxis protein n=1 Tax=Motilibacter aurantiacus TaxID=2714955 RepID=UPI00140B9662|nr:methyl-accepting chemotaxis protein [Motilibacter aurantiacus]NHC45716.1 GAF domain-containing protein [Motilibacter aurantiacus]